MISTKKFLMMMLILPISGCAYLGGGDKEEDLSLLTDSKTNIPLVEAFLLSGFSGYKLVGKQYRAQWLACSTSSSQKSIIVMHGETKSFEQKDFCDSWYAQPFLSAGFAVIAVNRPGFGESTGKTDFSGTHSMAAISSGVAAASNMLKIKNARGIWGYGSGATAAAVFAKSKNAKSPSFLILGSGAYDLEETLEKTKDSSLKNQLEDLQKRFGDSSFDDRSIAYDVEGLPKKIFLYHGKKDTSIFPSQSKNFYDSLISSEYRVTLEVIKGVGHNIPNKVHQKILRVLAHSAK
jgi:fermentation-respiration switch protein FrsA (DUF1100 family)